MCPTFPEPSTSVRPQRREDEILPCFLGPLVLCNYGAWTQNKAELLPLLWRCLETQTGEKL